MRPTRHVERPYLTELGLGDFLRQRLDPDIVADTIVPELAARIRPDFRSDRHRLCVEFDGNEHYERAAKVLGDVRRDQILSELGFSVVRIPYFVQLTGLVIRSLFGARITDQSDFLDFPHGFVADAVVFPADFCELGIERFVSDLNRFEPIRPAILATLKHAVERKGDWRLVYPPRLRQVVAAAPPEHLALQE